ncbi:sulfotransferase 1C2-like [Watersipora subatra]|uniref:sulfotransferase 1C2-like n=1 Tax=Watersipora subatra TaxID=2589382 RepID=UPI00355AD78F
MVYRSPKDRRRASLTPVTSGRRRANDLKGKSQSLCILREIMAALPLHPLSGAATGQYFVSDDGSVKVAALVMNKDIFPKVRSDLEEYKWNDSDFLLATFSKNGTHFMWEAMMMLLKGSADYIQGSKALLMIDTSPVSLGIKPFPSPRVLNTHYRTDVLPAEYRKAKTVVVMRNPKDTCVSFYYHYKSMLNPIENITFAQFVELFLHEKNIFFGRYFDYIEYMWSLKDEPNILLVFYEDLKMNPLNTIQKVNEFMGTNRSPELVKEIAEAVNFEKMKLGKTTLPLSKESMEMLKSMEYTSTPSSSSSSSSEMYQDEDDCSTGYGLQNIALQTG